MVSISFYNHHIHRLVDLASALILDSRYNTVQLGFIHTYVLALLN